MKKNQEAMPVLVLVLCLLSLVPTITGQNPSANCPTDVCQCLPQTDTNRRVIDCRDKGLREIPYFRPSEEIFQEVIFKSNMDDRNRNNITSIQSGAFRGLRVKSIDLGTNYISNVAYDAFNNVADDVEYLFLEGNGYSLIPFSSIAVLKKLKTLRLYNFYLPTITRNNFDTSHFNELEELELSNMVLTGVSENAFAGRLPKLRILKLNFLEFTDFPSLGFSPLVNLERIDVIYNKNIRRISYQSFKQFKKLRYLDFSHNSISELQPGCFEGIDNNLQYLYLHKNQLTETNVGALASARWTHLLELKLAFNRMKSIPDGLFFNMNSLRKLFLDYNSISELNQGSFQGLHHLQFLDFSYNSLSGLVSNGLLQTPRLEHLDLRGQNSEEFYISTGAFNGTEHSLKWLIMSNTPLVESSMWKEIKKIHSLEDLQLNEAGLTAVPDFQFSNSRNLQSLSLSSNDIHEINQRKMIGLDNLKFFSMQNNKLTTINSCTFQDMSKFESFYLLRNPLICDCNLLWFKDWITSKEAEGLKYRYSITAHCKNPVEGSLFTVRKEDMCSQAQTTPTACENITLSTSAPSPLQTTTRPTNTDSLLRFTQISETQNTIEVRWSSENSFSFSGYTLHYQLLGENAVPYEVALDNEETKYIITELQRNSQYLVCLMASPRGKLIVQQQKACLALRTLQ